MHEPVLVSIAAALAAKTAASLFDLVKRKFAGKKEATEALEAAQGTAPDSPEVTALAAELAAATKEDAAFDTALRRQWTHLSAEPGSVINEIHGNVSGKVVQARDIEGGINF